MKRKLYDGDTFAHKGYAFRFRTERDEYMGEPWKEHDGHGIVTNWRRYVANGHGVGSKAPGERVLVQDRSNARFYNIAESLKIAKRDGWGISEESTKKLTERYIHRTARRLAAGLPALTKNEIAAQAVEEDYERLKAWCNDEWYWCSVIVTMLPTGLTDWPDGGFQASLSGLESDDRNEYLTEVAHDLADECLEQYQKYAQSVLV